VSELILNDTLGYTVPFTLLNDAKYMTEDKLKIKKLNTTQKKQTTQNTAKRNYPATDCNNK